MVSRSLLAFALATVACGTVDVGDPPADVNNCRPDRLFFVNEVWPNYLDKPVGMPAKKCTDARCHDATSGRQLILQPPTSPKPTTLPLPQDWEAVYKSTTNQLSCTNVAQSTLLMRPDGRQTHGGGTLFAPTDPMEQIIFRWANTL